MKLEDLFSLFPAKRIEPIDGMSVTADVWEEAHQYHRKIQQFHTLVHHSWGIVSGLDVIASDPPDSAVFITPGIAVDSNGRIVVLSQPVSYDLGDEIKGTVYLLLTYDESPPRHDHPDDPDDALLYVRSELLIQARNSLPNNPYVELCRLERDSADDVILNAKNGFTPQTNEIDLRHRREISFIKEASIAVAYLGEGHDKKHSFGVRNLANALRQSSSFYLSINDDEKIAPGIETNTLIYLVGCGDFELDNRQITGLTNYVNKGKGTLLLESLDQAGWQSFLSFLKKANIEPEKISQGHALLKEPHLFAAPPPGYTPGDLDVLVFNGGMLSPRNYGLLWHGELEGALPPRELIRTGFEWGQNIVTYAYRRRQLPAA